MSDIVAAKFSLGGLSFGGATKRDLKNETNAHDKTKLELDQATKELESVRAIKNKIQIELDDAAQKLSSVRSVFENSDTDIWLSRPADRPAEYDKRMQNSIPILLFANLKGGVGKTTLAANLATYFEVQHGERVLAIDLDFQGSLSSMLSAAADTERGNLAHSAMSIIGPSFDPKTLLHHAPAIRDSIKDSRVITCGSAFAAFESMVSLKWLLGDFESDLRYHLATLLLSPEVQERFDRVIIDAPPRNTAALINALCASNYLIVPTVLDRLSTYGVASFLGDINRLKGRLFPELSVLGVIGTMKRTGTMSREKSETAALEHLKATLREKLQSDHYLWEDHLMPRMEAFAKTAGVEVAYHQLGSDNIIDQMGKELAAKAPRKKIQGR
jgi:cellulose biosynthesis protein BcsQ